MKVMLVNGSPHENGCTHTALTEAAGVLQKEGIATEIFWIGTKPISGCIACHSCAKTGQCCFADIVNQFLVKANEADGFIFGSPVHYAALSGGMTSFMDRAFYSVGAFHADTFYLKPGAGILSARRGGTTAAFDQLNKYMTIAQMPVISSQYWNMVHGSTPQDVAQDLEGLQTMRTLGRNMAWFLKCKEAGAKAGIPLPEKEKTLRTNFIR